MVSSDARNLVRLARIAGEATEFPASQTIDAIEFVLRELCDWLGADNAFWVGSTLDPRLSTRADPLRGWRPRSQLFAHSTSHSHRLSQAFYDRMADAQFDPQTVALAKSAGSDRCFLLPEVADSATRERHWAYAEVLAPAGIADRMVAGAPIAADCEAFIGLDRGPEAPAFGDDERAALLATMHAIRGLHFRGALVHGWVRASAPLSPRERSIMLRLVSDASEREIAGEFRLTPRTVHQYATVIYRKFGVRGRLGLLSLWLERQSAPTTVAQ